MLDDQKTADRDASKPDKRKLLDALYPIPDPYESDEEAELHRHDDLPKLSPAELHLEGERVRFRLLFDDHPRRWLLERLDAIDAEGARRGH